MKTIVFKITTGLCLGVLLVSCQNKPEKTHEEPQERVTVDWKVAQNYYYENITDAITLLDSLKTLGMDDSISKHVFAALRVAFKKAEPYASYLNPEVGHRANGPALPIYKEDNGKILKPVGLQKIEESIYEEGTSKQDFLRELEITKGMFTNLQRNIHKMPLNPQRFFVSTHQQLFRIVSLALAGFDTPISQLSLKETAVSLEALVYVYDNSIKSIILEKAPSLDKEFRINIQKATAYVHQNPDFADFDRFTFIRDYLNPITRNWVSIRKQSGLWEGSVSFPFNFDAPTFFEKDAFNPSYFKATNNRNPTKEQIKLGEKLFFDTSISKSGQMSCATCHVPEKAYADGLVSHDDNSGQPLKRNTPTLINVVFQKAFFWEGRSSTLDDQISAVFTNKKEFDADVHQFSLDLLKKDSTYVQMFKEAFGKVPKRNRETVKAISSFVASLNGFNSKFDKNIRGEADDFTDAELRGFNLYMGKALCATCHFIPLTNGTVPPFFNETEKEVIGVPKTPENKALDDDLGFYTMFGEDIHRGMFKTPTIRNASLTAPYMHNGVYKTLEEVITFYTQGGGGGMGFDLEHQTLPFDNLNLTEQEQSDLVAFIHTLEDPLLKITEEKY